MSVGRQLAVGGLMLSLAAIDFGAALVAKDFADRRRLPALLVGCALQIALFLVYALALRLADLTIVTMGWIVLLQVALIGTDVTRNGLRLSPPQWSAVALVIVLQVYLVATTDGSTRSTTAYGMPGPADVAEAYPTAAPAQRSLSGSAPEISPKGAEATRDHRPSALVGPEGQTSIGVPGRSPVTRNTTRRATDTAWSANRS